MKIMHDLLGVLVQCLSNSIDNYFNVTHVKTNNTSVSAYEWCQVQAIENHPLDTDEDLIDGACRYMDVLNNELDGTEVSDHDIIAIANHILNRLTSRICVLSNNR